ncbi:TetR/AcrR family transcriptional regulator [Cryptosporangium phraense]|uniref:TetR/AcrR family transcriptional regulator n=1 Tax=Cryptosporangium phraense TaxID=2593070 RepID=UPI0014788141|nr:TetR family transcriptional regulator [Cryptosporangium phraense]
MAAYGELNAAAIQAAALALVDEKGYTGLSMRNLGTQLGVTAASLYYHVPNRVTLLRLLADRIATEATARLDPALGWRDLLLSLARDLRRTLAAHPGATVIVATQDVSPEVWEPLVPPLLASLRAGLDVSDDVALLLAQSVYVLVTGLALAEFGDAPEPPAAPSGFYDAWFDVAVTTFLDGIAARYSRE